MMKISTFKVDNITNYYFILSIPVIFIIIFIILAYKINKKEYLPIGKFNDVPYEIIILFILFIIFSTIAFYAEKPDALYAEKPETENFSSTTCLSYKYPENCEKNTNCSWDRTKNTCNENNSYTQNKKSPFATDASYPTCDTMSRSDCNNAYNCRYTNKPAGCNYITEIINGVSYTFSNDSYNNKVYFDLLKNETLIYVTTNNALFNITTDTNGSKKYYLNDDEYLYFKGVMYKIVYGTDGTKKYYLNNDEYRFKNGELISVNEVKVSYLINKYIL